MWVDKLVQSAAQVDLCTLPLLLLIITMINSLNKVGWDVLDSTSPYLVIDFTFFCGRLQVLLYIAIDVFLLVLHA